MSEPAEPRIRSLLALSLTPGLGPVLIARLLESFRSPEVALGASLAALKTIRGIGDAKARAIFESLRDAAARADRELALAEKLGVSLIPLGDPTYPPLLAQTPGAPTILYVRGTLHAATHPNQTDPEPPADRYPIAIVGSRSCTHYGVEQAERFAGHLAASGLTIVSGGARGIDTAAHRSALRNNGRTICVLGCGLAHTYPEENAELFARIADGRGAIVSELPLETAPSSENFPARNRIIAGLSLGVLVIEAGRGSGALITARVAAEDHGREVFALPGRVDSPASQGSLDLLKDGGALLVTEPADVLSLLESPARHLHADTHAARYAGRGSDTTSPHTPTDLFSPDTVAPRATPVLEPAPRLARALSPSQSRILAALAEPLTADELCAATGLDPSAVRSDLTFLELDRRVSRAGSRLRRVAHPGA
ncbi:MAG: DNA-processing protein DprA [Phycisphaerales bacterium]